MTDADSIRAEISNAIDLAERVQATWHAYQDAVHQLQGAVSLLDLRSDSTYSRSAARMSPLIGRDLSLDAEVIGQVKSTLQDWLPRV
jgi:hypothetical protein